MYFKNAQIYRLSPEWAIDIDAIESQLAKKAFAPCGSQDMERCGWISPADNGCLVHEVGGHWLVALGFERRLLPSSVIKQEADERAAEMAEQQGFKLGRKQMKDLREQVTLELMPRAFTKRTKVCAWIDTVGGWLAVDAPSRSRAEDVIEALRHCLDVFPVTLVRAERSPVSAMADWLAAGEAPAGFTIDQDCELRSVTEDRSAVRYMHHPLEGDEVRGHLAAAKLPTRLAMTFEDRVSFVLTESLEIKRLDFLDVVRDQIDGQEEDEGALFNAELALMTGELSRLISAMVEALGGELKRDPDLVDMANRVAA